jgi:hypothetical protein
MRIAEGYVRHEIAKRFLVGNSPRDSDMHGQCSEAPRVLSVDETLLISGGGQSVFHNGNFERFVYSENGQVLSVLEATFTDGPMGPGGGTPPMHQRLQN